MIEDLERRQLERTEFVKEFEKSNMMNVTLVNLEKRRHELSKR